MKSTPKSKSTKPKRGRPSLGGRQRPILPRTSVAPATLAGILAHPLPNGRLIDDLWECYEITRKAAERQGVEHGAWLLRLV